MAKKTLIMLLPFLLGCFKSTGPKLLWQVPIASQIPPLVQNGTVYVQGFPAGQPDTPVRLFALNAMTGEIRWESLDSVKEVYGESGGYVFIRNTADHFVQLQALTGEKIYESPEVIDPILSWVIRGDIMFMVNTSMEVVAVDNRKSEVLWRMKLPFHPGDDTSIQLAEGKVIVNGNFRNNDDQFGMIWALDAATGKELWHFEPPLPHDYAPLKVLVHNNYIVATNTAPTLLQTHILDAQSGKEKYAPIPIFDVYGFQGNTVYAPSGAFDLTDGRETGPVAKWVLNSVLHNGIAWQRQISSVNAWQAFFLRDTYDGDFQGHRHWLNTPPNSAIQGFDLVTGKPLFQTRTYQFTQFSTPVEAEGILFHTSIAVMKEGKSGVWAYRLPSSH